MSILNEDSRKELVAKSKTGEREKTDGKTRYEKRLKSRVASSTKQYNRIDMNQLFKENIITVGIEISGETDNYLVKISYGGFLDALYEELKRNNNQLELRNIIKALIIAFNREDVYIWCSCPDWKYRFAYWATVEKTNSGQIELRPANETNPDNKLGSGCKHVLLVLSNTSWLIKVASVIMNYIKYMEKHRQKQYQDIIYPAIYKTKYIEPVQLDIFDEEPLETDEETIDKSNIYARTKTQFKPGNKYRIPSSNKLKGQEEIEIEEEE